jgi:hypothetical protein
MIHAQEPFSSSRRTGFRGLGQGLLLLLMATATGCDHPPTGPAKAPPDRIRGFNFADWTAGGYFDPPAAASLAELDAVGANSISIVITAYQESPAGSTIRLDDPRTPTSAAVSGAIEFAQRRGLTVVLKPHVDLDDGSWRGHIDPADAGAWFADYEVFVLEWALLARERGVEGLMIGTELAGTLQHEGRWRGLIGKVRAEFSGWLTYAASWDEAHLVPFWSELDYVGIDFYFPVARRADPSRLEILAGWQPWLGRLARLHGQTGRPILITEIGFRSVDGAAMHPYAFGNGAALDLDEQADLYWGAVEAAAGADWIAGLYFWNWLAAGGGGPDDTDYTPQGKPAEDVLAEAWNP